MLLHANIAFGWAARVAGRTPPPLRVRAWGLSFPPQLPAALTAWARFTTGIWAAVVEVDIPSFNGQASVTATLWAPSDAVTPAEHD